MSSSDSDSLPSGWEKRFDDVTQTFFFVDHNERKTQWNHPNTGLIYRPNNEISTPTNISLTLGNKIPVNETNNIAENSSVDQPYNAFPSIVAVMNRAKVYAVEVDAFTGSCTDREYIRLMELLERCLLELDDIGLDGLENLRNARRSAVRDIMQTIEMLEFRGQISGSLNGQKEEEEEVNNTTE